MDLLMTRISGMPIGTALPFGARVGSADAARKRVRPIGRSAGVKADAAAGTRE